MSRLLFRLSYTASGDIGLTAGRAGNLDCRLGRQSLPRLTEPQYGIEP